MRCPCARKSETTTYADCCEPYHAGKKPAPTAETLMRSRYAAFVMCNSAYLLETWHASTRPPAIAFDPDQTWLGLRILASRAIGDEAFVEFIARSRIGGRAHKLREVSRFRRENGRWSYVDGDVANS